MEFFTDVGYRDTARMLVEAGLHLLEDSPGRGGLLTPGSGLGVGYLARLQRTGTKWTVVESPRGL